jgi:putative ABC transport system permease protein
MNLSAWRVGLRIARRDALRHKARSALVVVMIGLPILGVVTADVLLRSSQLTASEQLPRKLGNADALVSSAYGGTAIEQVPDGSTWGSPGVDSGSGPAPAEPTPLTLAQVRAVLPAGSQIATWRTDSGQVHFGDAPGREVTIDELDYTSPAATGIVIQDSGRAPRTTHEVALSEATARRLGVRASDTVTIQLSSGGPATYRVTGIVQQRFHPDTDVAVVSPGTLLTDTPPGVVAFTQYLVKSPRPITWDDVMRANSVGAVLVARSVIDHPPPRSAVPYYQLAATDNLRFGVQSGRSATAVATIGVVAVMCVLEIVFLAGPAFAIGARTQRRQLGLVVATGGEPRDARHVVLGGGIVLGAAGGVIGVVLGIATALAIRHWRITRGTDFGGLHLHGFEIAGAAAIGLVVGVAAALLPARTAATQDVVGALAGRRPAGKLRKRVSVVGLVTVAAGVALTAYGATQDPQSADVAYGSALAELGLAACAPALVAMAGGLARWLPLTPRLALREGARNRARTASAVAAVMAAVAGSVAVGIYAASDDLAAKHSYQPLLRAGQTALPLWKNDDSAQAGQIAAAVAAVVPVHSTALVGIPPVCSYPTADCVSYQTVRPASENCPPPPQGTFSKPQLLKWETDPRCDQTYNLGLFSQVVVGGPDVLRLLVGHDDPAADQVLATGGVVVFSPLYLDAGRVSIETDKSHGDSQPTAAGTTAFDAALVSLTPAPSALLSPAAAAKLGIAPAVGGILFDSDKTTTRAQEHKADSAIRHFDAEYSLVVERGYHGHLPTQLLLAFLGAAIVTIGAAGAATGLAIADARPDHTTLVAVGAAPGTRRRLAMAAAGTIALIGAVLGAATGFVPALGVLRQHQTLLPQFGGVSSTSAGSSGFVYVGGALGNAFRGVAVSIPWPLITLVVLGLPTLTALFAGAFTRSQRVVERRVV